MSPKADSPLLPSAPARLMVQSTGLSRPNEGIVVVLANVELDVDTLAGDLMQAARP